MQEPHWIGMWVFRVQIFFVSYFKRCRDTTTKTCDEVLSKKIDSQSFLVAFRVLSEAQACTSGAGAPLEGQGLFQVEIFYIPYFKRCRDITTKTFDEVLSKKIRLSVFLGCF